MEKQRDLLFFCLVLACSSSFLPWVSSSSSEGGPEKAPPKLLFVFGDSYADTGNTEELSVAWVPPYGSTFPGEPSGRFSDGLVLTDYVASYFGIESPHPYRLRNHVNKTVLQHGMNFAYGGTGVFDTMAKEPNMTTQIDFFQSSVEQNVYTKHDLSSSVALVSLAGNDYAAFAMKKGKPEELPSFIASVIDQLIHNLKRIRGLGVGKIMVTALGPLGCLPQLTAVSSFKNCSSKWDSIARLHNLKLRQSLQELKTNESITGSSCLSSSSSALTVLDLDSAFISAFDMLRHRSGELSENPLKPCCVGMTAGYSCGSVGDKGVKNYVVCDHPETSFFWDNIHPSQYGWRAVYSFLGSSLHHLL
ncbi:GDSL esterase/lipase At5g03610-like isoform X1 [Rhodamnia argentea]|uniref:GDSL esterase/lipase At5g03610-like isoform X1 n=1 Tax=Rhodamnia argentea TaxID=178133 RepID=A0ABM3HES6_9MYRT|nr:GDSL esterase/lipase At5g03610-like isoform X1 [Rhodamnia argentea]